MPVTRCQDNLKDNMKNTVSECTKVTVAILCTITCLAMIMVIHGCGLGGSTNDQDFRKFVPKRNISPTKSSQPAHNQGRDQGVTAADSYESYGPPQRQFSTPIQPPKLVTTVMQNGGKSGSNPYQNSDVRSVVFQASAQKQRSRNILWVIDNSSSMVRLQFHHQAIDSVTSFIEKYHSHNVRIGVISAQKQGVRFCVPQILAQDMKTNMSRDFGWTLPLNLSNSQVVQINCAIESFSPLATLIKFLSPRTYVAGVSGDWFFQSDALSAIIVVTDDFPLKSHVTEFRRLMQSRFMDRSTSFYSFSSSGSELYEDEIFTTNIDNTLYPPYNELRESGIRSKCGNGYTPAYLNLTREYSGRQFPICASDWQNALQTIMNDLDTKSLRYQNLNMLSLRVFNLLQVKVDGQELPPNAYRLGGRSHPVLILADQVMVKANSQIELMIESR
ncbi:MAG: hypothetical protein OXC40_04210 [Proteobacteria bacterium]|nr:hypothetical protein [Pseudomonadota bacterium]